MASFVTEFKHLEIQLEEIKSATNNFDESKVIGRGGFGKVYAGELSHSQSGEKSLVAIKRLDRRYGQGDPEFFKEIRMLSCYRHENLISLLGFCKQGGEMILIYEYASRGSLDRYLSSADLTWMQRLRICVDAAKGLSFLHDPNGTQQRVLHCDIKSANILLDKNMTAKVSDFGLSKMGPANQQYSLLITSAVGTPGYCDPLYMETYSLTKESDVYSFGVVLFEVLSGKLCVEFIKGQLKVYVPFWKKSYEENKLDEIILQDLMQQMDPSSLKTFSDIAFQCLHKAREERPTMSLVVEKLQIALQMQVLPKEYAKIANAAVDPLLCRSLEEFKELLSKGVLLNRGNTWLSLNDKEEHHVMVSIEEYLSLDDPNRDYSDRYSSKEKSRFAVGCYKTRLMEFKLHVTAPLFVSPDVTYGLNLVLHTSEIEGMKQQYVGVRYKIQGETKISILHFADKKEGRQLVAELYQFNSTEESILDLEIYLEDCGLLGDFYIEGIEFRPLKKVARQVVILNQEIVRGVVPPLFYSITEESEVLLSQEVLLNGGKTWLSINNKRELCVLISIEDCLIRDKPNGNDSAKFSLEKDSRFAVGCYKAYSMNFKIRVRTPFILSPHVTYGINLIFKYINIEQMQQQSLPIRYKLHGETKISIVHYADAREDEWLVAELYQFTSEEDKSILDTEIVFERCGLSDYFYIEGIEFQPLEKVEHPVGEYEEILKAAVPHVFYRSAEELKVLLSRGILLNEGKMWFSINDKEEHCLMLSIEDCLVCNAPNSDEYSFEKNSRFAVGCYFTKSMNFKIRVRTPLFLSPSVRYRLNLVFKHSKIEQMEQQFFPVWYNLQGEAKMAIAYLDDKREDGWLVAEFYQFTSDGDKSILDLEIIFEKCGFSGDLYIEGIEFQPLGRVEHAAVVVEYEEILKGAVTPLFYTSSEELKLFLTRGIILNGYKTWLSITEKGEHIERIYIEASLTPAVIKANGLKHPYGDIVNSRFPGGRCYEYLLKFKARVRGQYLTPQISYTLNLVFRYRWQYEVNSYNPLRYKIDGEDETKVSIIYPSYMREDGWYVAPLYQFTSQHKTIDLQFDFENRATFLLVAGIEFQPSEEKVELQMFKEYQDIINVASQSLFYTSLDELKQILSNGVHLNGYKTFFSLNEKGEHCHMISMEDCLIPNEDFPSRYKSHSWSRFPAGLYQTNKKGFITHVKTQLLSPLITYTVNLVFNGSSYVDLKYRIRGETTTSTVYLANRREDDMSHMAELYQFTSDGSIVELEITFDNHGSNLQVEGILFQPLENVTNVEDQVLVDDNVDDIQSISDSDSDRDTYWEQNLPNYYKEILKPSKRSVEKKTSKELNSILCKWYLIDNDQQCFNLDNNGKKCQMLSARATWVIDDKNLAWESLPESRFGEVLVITAGDKFEINREIKSKEVSLKTKYAAYVVYKLPKDQSTFEAPLEVTYRYDCWYIFLVRPPQTPVIGPNFDKNSHNPLNRYKGNAIPKQRSDGWMEVQVWEFQTDEYETVYMNLKLEHPGKKDLGGLMVQGIELRPI